MTGHTAGPGFTGRANVAEADGAEDTDLARRLLAEDATLAANLASVAEAGCVLLDGCSSASITLIERDRASTIAATGDLAAVVDEAQYAAGAGPCLLAARTQRVVGVPRVEREERWPEFARAAARAGVGSSLSVPLDLPDPQMFGALNCYASEPEAFAQPEERIIRSFAAQAAAVVSNAIVYWGALDQAANLAKAMETRAVIEQAKGILMATQRCTPDAAFDLLRRASQRENRKLRDLAQEIVDRTSGAVPT
jgi:GAF domain-containing protein